MYLLCSRWVSSNTQSLKLIMCSSQCFYYDRSGIGIFIVWSIKKENEWMFDTCVTHTHSTYYFFVSEYESLLLLGAGRKASWGSDCSTTSGVAAETEGTILWGKTQSKNIFLFFYKLLWVEWVQGKTVAFRLWLLCLVSCLFAYHYWNVQRA